MNTFSKGARAIHVTQSAVSQRISALEESLGTSLFICGRTNLRLNQHGEKLLRYCQSQEQQENELLSVLKVDDTQTKKISGVIRIGGFSSIARSGIMPALAPILRKHGELGLTLVTKELSELMPILKNGEVDFIISNKDPKRQDIQAIYLGIEENILVESKKIINSLNYLDHDADDVTTTSYFRVNKKDNQKFEQRYVDDVYGLIDGVKLGLGRAVLSKHLTQNETEFKVLHPESILKVRMYLMFYKLECGRLNGIDVVKV